MREKKAEDSASESSLVPDTEDQIKGMPEEHRGKGTACPVTGGLRVSRYRPALNVSLGIHLKGDMLKLNFGEAHGSIGGFSLYCGRRTGWKRRGL